MFLEGYQIAVANHHYNDEYTTSESEARLAFLGISAFPTLLPDGGAEPSYPYSHQILEDTINDRMAIDSPCTLEISGQLINNDLTVNVSVLKDDGAEMPNARVQVVVTENAIPCVWGSLTTVEFVNREMIPDQNGTALTFNGNLAEVSVTATLDPTWVQENIIVVAFVEDSSNHNVFQTTQAYLEFFMAHPDAPASPDYLAGTPDPGGELSCELNWYNPILDFSGDPLAELLEMRLYRDEDLIYTNSNPTIGAYETFTDIPVEPGLYDYMIAGYNSFGEGPGANVELWIGEDVPNVVEDLELENIGGEAYLSWTNPITGLHGGAFNNPITGYYIERNDGVVFELPGIATEYTDNTVASGVYFYTVQPYNVVGEGAVATSNSVFFGEGSVFNVFIQCDDFGSETTWDIIDSEGEILFSGGPYGENEVVDVDCILTEGNYIFTIYDAWGDGICCAFGEGYYILTLNGTIIFEGNGQFYTEEFTPFTVEGGIVLDPPANLAVTSNTGDDFATFSWEAPAVDEITGYDVYLDNALLGNTAELQWQYNDLINGTLYEAGVVAVYDTGASDLVTLEFTFEGTGVDDLPELITALQNNYPNPFNPTTNIAFSLDEAKHVTLEVFNIKGEKVKTLIDNEIPADHHNVIWNGTDSSSRAVASGIYFYKMKAGKFVETRKMILMK